MHNQRVSQKALPKALPAQFRAATVDSFDYDARTVTFALTSENPVSRWYGDEILDHSEKSIDTERLKRGIPLLYNHKDHIGRIESHEIRDKKLYVTARFGNSPLAQEKLNDVRDGILVDASGGYIPRDYEFTEGKKGSADTVRWTSWMPVEGSLCPVPADPTVGVGRSEAGAEYPVRRLGMDGKDLGTEDAARAADVSKTATAEQKEERMTEEEKRALQEAAARNAAQSERERIGEINAIQREHGDHFTREAADKAIADGASAAEVRKAVLANQREAAKAASVRTGAPAEHTAEVTVDVADKGEKGIRMARTLRCLAAGKGDLVRAGRFAREIGDAFLERSFAAAASSAVDGGYQMQGTVSGEIIELLRPVAVVRSLNPTIVPLDGTYTQNRLSAGASGGYIGENKDIPASKGKFAQLKLSAKKLAALIPVSNDLLRRGGGPQADAAVREDLIVSLANTEDVSFIRSPGSVYSPKGMRYWVQPANLIPATDVSALTGNALVAAIKSDLGKLKLALRAANVRFLRPGIILSPRTEYFLQNVLNGFGVPVFEAEMAQGRLMGYPYRTTTQIPENLTISAVTGCTEIYFADFADVTIGDAPQIGVEFSTEASYIDPGTQQLVSAFSQDQTVMRVIIEHDLGMRHAESLAILNSVTWGK